MPGTCYVEPNQEASMVTVNERCARNKVLLTKHMPGIGQAEPYPVQNVAWFAVYSTTLSQPLRMHVMATPYIFLSKQKILTKHL